MGRCISPFRKKGESIDLPCGKCYECKARRVSGWSYRLMKEAERSTSAFFITLTYDTLNVPMTKNNMMTLWKPDFQNFMKALRKLNHEKIKYYVAGEYGEQTMRPHYHIILFNAKEETIKEAWTKGEIHYGEASEASAGYTLKYISKSGKIPQHKNDFRVPEFSLMSKRMGDNYLTDAVKKWHKADLLGRCYVPLKDGKKIAMPRYYKEKIYTKLELQIIGANAEQQFYAEFHSENPAIRKMAHEKSEKQVLVSINKAQKNGKESRKTSL